jgi:hypothetical protein
MYAHVVFISLCVFLPIACCHETAPGLDLEDNDLSKSVSPHTDARRKRTRGTEYVCQKLSRAASDHASQHQHQSQDRSDLSGNVNTGMTPP